jgi:hypothetical protein
MIVYWRPDDEKHASNFTQWPGQDSRLDGAPSPNRQETLDQ